MQIAHDNNAANQFLSLKASRQYITAEANTTLKSTMKIMDNTLFNIVFFVSRYAPALADP